jgi:hypothetical protein
MIMGVAAKVAPTLQGLNVHALSPLWWPFALVNIGCSLRVLGQVSTDWTAAAYPVAGISGLLEVTGLAVWGVHLSIILSGRGRLLEHGPRRGTFFVPCVPGAAIVAGNRVADVLDQYPELLEVFVNFGFRLLTNPVLRRSLARQVTIIGACRKMDVPLDPLLQALNERRPRPAVSKQSLPLIDNAQRESTRCVAHTN